LVENLNFFIPLHSTPELGSPRWNTDITLGMETLEWCGLPDNEKKLDGVFMSFDIIPRRVSDRETDRQTSYDSIVRAIHSIAR